MQLWVNSLVEYPFQDSSAVAITALFFFSVRQSIHVSFSIKDIFSSSALYK